MHTRFALAILLAGAVAGLGCDGSEVGTAFAGEILVGDTLRSFVLYAPDVSALGAAAPLVLVFHGSGSSGSGMRLIGGFDDLADREGFVVAYPDATLGNWAEDCGCNNADRLGINDTGFVSALIDSLFAAFPIDPTRVYAAGLSQGGLFAHRLACQLSDRFAAVASVVAPISAPLAASCAPADPVGVLTLMGTADATFPFEGGGEGNRAVLGARATAETWRGLNGCTGDPTVTRDGDTQIDRWSTCMGGVEVALYGVEGGRHTWNPSANLGTARVLTGFFLAHTR